MNFNFTVQPRKVSNTQGFTLVETLVAITLLLIAVVGPITFLSRSSQGTEVANQQILATFLAQEGLELVQSERENEFLEWFDDNSHDAWTEFRDTFSNCVGASNPCAVEITSSGGVAVNECGATDNNCFLYYDAANDRSPYTYDNSGDVTPYRRYIYLDIIETDREVRVVSEVAWRSGSLIDQQLVKVETSLLNIYDTN